MIIIITYDVKMDITEIMKDLGVPEILYADYEYEMNITIARNANPSIENICPSHIHINLKNKLAMCYISHSMWVNMTHMGLIKIMKMVNMINPRYNICPYKTNIYDLFVEDKFNALINICDYKPTFREIPNDINKDIWLDMVDKGVEYRMRCRILNVGY